VERGNREQGTGNSRKESTRQKEKKGSKGKDFLSLIIRT